MIKISTLFDFDKVSFEKESDVHLDVILKAPARDMSKRIPLHLILAIDCSGSMIGTKLSQVKSTVKKLVDHLTENDSLGIISFASNAQEVTSTVPMTDANKKYAKEQIDGIQASSVTNLSEAITFATERSISADKSKVCRIILLTDGQPTCGTCDRDSLIKLVETINPSISISTFGYGSDFDSDLMSSISTTGRGNNFYIKEDLDCNSAFAAELGGLLSLYGQNIKIRLSPSSNMSFTELLSEYKCEQKNGYRLITPSKFDVSIDDIFAGESKHIIMKLKVPKATEAVCARETSVCKIIVDYLDVETKVTQSVSATAKIQYVKEDKTSKIANKTVREQLAIIEAIKIQKAAKEEAEKQNYTAAQEILTKGIAWAANNIDLGAMAPALTGTYSAMSISYSSATNYNLVGSKLSNSFYQTMAKGRAATSNDIGSGIIYETSTMQEVEKSFKDDTSKKKRNK